MKEHNQVKLTDTLEHLSELLEEARAVYGAAEASGRVKVDVGHYRRLSHGQELLKRQLEAITSPSTPQPVEVTEEMVERALLAEIGGWSISGIIATAADTYGLIEREATPQERMRAAFTASLKGATDV